MTKIKILFSFVYDAGQICKYCRWNDGGTWGRKTHKRTLRWFQPWHANILIFCGSLWHDQNIVPQTTNSMIKINKDIIDIATLSPSLSGSLASLAQMTNLMCWSTLHVKPSFPLLHTQWSVKYLLHIDTTQPTNQNNLKHLLLGWYYNR